MVASGRSQVAGSEGSAGPRADLPPANLQPATLHALKLTFPDSNPDVRIEPFDPLTTTVSYFIGNDPEQWRPDVPVWGGVRYVDLYPGVDLVFGPAGNSWQMKVRSGAATGLQRVQIEGAAMETVERGMLHLFVDDNPLSLALPQAPFAYQVSGISQQGEWLNLEVPANARAPQPAHAGDNPVSLIFSTFLGGGRHDYSEDGAVDGTGSVYVIGTTDSDDLPSTPGALDPSFNGYAYNQDAFVAKLNRLGSGLAYATFLGGRSIDEGIALAVDTSGNAYATGYTTSDDFPTTPDAFDPSYNDIGAWDVFAVKLDPTGSRLIYGTYLGTDDNDRGFAIAVDAAGSAYVAGNTFSGDFPTTPGSYDTTYGGGRYGDAFIVKLATDGSSLLYGTFLGGTGTDGVFAIALDEAGDALVAGFTNSSDFPTTPSAFDPVFDNYLYGEYFVAKLNPTGSALVFSTFLGGSGSDGVADIAVDDTGSVYVTGKTASQDFPTTPGAFDTSYNGAIGYYDAFVVRLNQDGRFLHYGTYLGGTHDEEGMAIAVDETGSAIVTGFTLSADFPTTQGAFDTSFNSVYGNSDDAFVARLNPAGSSLTYASFLGGRLGDAGGAIATDHAGNAFITGWTNSTDFPITPNSFDQSYNGNTDAFTVKLNVYIPHVVAPVDLPHAGSFVSGTVTISGYAIDQSSVRGTGIDHLPIYLDSPYATGDYLGEATYGLERPDVAVLYGACFDPSGWELVWDTGGIMPGVHALYLYVHRTTDDAWSELPPHIVIVTRKHAYWLLPIALRTQ